MAFTYIDSFAERFNSTSYQEVIYLNFAKHRHKHKYATGVHYSQEDDFNKSVKCVTSTEEIKQ